MVPIKTALPLSSSHEATLPTEFFGLSLGLGTMKGGIMDGRVDLKSRQVGIKRRAHLLGVRRLEALSHPSRGQFRRPKEVDHAENAGPGKRRKILRWCPLPKKLTSSP